jgi:hypothetical protein
MLALGRYSLWAFGGLVALFILIEAFTGGTITQPGTGGAAMRSVGMRAGGGLTSVPWPMGRALVSLRRLPPVPADGRVPRSARADPACDTPGTSHGGCLE